METPTLGAFVCKTKQNFEYKRKRNNKKKCCIDFVGYKVGFIGEKEMMKKKKWRKKWLIWEVIEEIFQIMMNFLEAQKRERFFLSSLCKIFYKIKVDEFIGFDLKFFI